MSSDDLLVNPKTRRMLTDLRSNLPQSILLHGRSGVGLLTIAQTLGNPIIEIIYPTDPKGNIDHISGSISVSEIRKLHELAKSKAKEQQLIIIDDADHMTLQAQQAFLKLLEEPNDFTRLILTSHAPEKLIPTIRSRVQSYAVLPITLTQSHDYLANIGLDDDTITKISFLAEGNPAQLHNLATNESERARTFELIRKAREYLVVDKYRRLIVALSYSNRADALEFISIAITLLKSQLTKNSDIRSIEKLDRLIGLEQHISRGGNTKLSLARGVL